ncbi:hypothetical protein D3C86_1601120 [compost metagenome]
MVLEGLQGLAHGAQLLWLAAQGCQPRGLGLEADAQLQHGQYIDRFIELMCIEQQPRAFACRQHKSAYAMARLHQTRGLQLGQRLAHHRAAHVIAAHQFRLGRKLVALVQQTLTDLLAKIFRQQIGQAAAAAAGLAAQCRPVRRQQKCCRLG